MISGEKDVRGFSKIVHPRLSRHTPPFLGAVDELRRAQDLANPSQKGLDPAFNRVLHKDGGISPTTDSRTIKRKLLVKQTCTVINR
jgi:hypothetical protein